MLVCPGLLKVHRATAERVVPRLRIRRDRSAHQAPDPPQGHRQDGAAGAHRTRTAAEGSLRGLHPRVRRDRREAPRRVRCDRSMGRVHAADQRGIHPPYYQARPRAPGGTEDSRPHPRPAVCEAEALRRPVLRRQAVHRTPQRPSPGDQGARPPPALAAGHRDIRRGHRVRQPRPGDELPSIAELSALQGIGTGVTRKAVEALAADGLIIVRHGRAAVVAGEPSGDPRLSRRQPGPGHDCRLAGCRPHVCIR